MTIPKDNEFADMVDTAIPQCKELAGKPGKRAEAIDNLLTLEKQTRLGGDAASTAKLAVAVVQILHSARDWTGLNEHIILLSKRRAQHKQVLTKMVQEAVPYVDETPDMDTKLALIKTLRLVSEGKIHVEVERARLTQVLAKIKEDEGKVSEAAELMQEVQVETYGAMEKREKTEFILEQCRLCLDSKDYVRALIITRKISPKTFMDSALDDLKVRFHKLLIRYHSFYHNYLDIARSYNAICDTKLVQEDGEEYAQNLRQCCLYTILAPHDSEQSDLLHRVYTIKKLEDTPMYKELLKQFITQELLRWPTLYSTYSAEFQSFAVFQGEESENQYWKDLKLRVIEHNIRVLAQYYQRINLSRMASLLDLTEAQAEKHLCDLVVKKTIFARVDRPVGVINFQPHKEAADRLSEWASDIGKLLELLDNTCHIINKENMMHRV